ncbi:putative at hook domain-containing protein [Diplodia seriata]|uniref:Putative at hook domain-containing protein n=1 Tax=Diplodia seriata TaxID=420778 RepID=A0A0G2EAG4_9PEZI|nr:putative at hook domain-containing protein [Diplodia seriata]
MSPPDNANSFVGRLASFESPRQLTKRRASSTKKRIATTVSWPHETPSPEDLARAGFYYSPLASHPDNVVCFMCNHNLDGWDPEDVPALEHLSLAPECAWAINACLPLREPEENEDPMSERMVAARTATFAESWPHESRKGWKCKTKKMVEAGWCYDPSPENEDGVACFYCMLSLDGWEPKDDPKEEHYKRSPDCPFFMLNDVYADARRATKGKKGRAATASKTSRLSIQSTRDFDTFSEAPSLMSLGDDAPHEDDTVLTTASNATTTSMARGKKGTGKAKATTKNTRKTNRAKKAADEPSVVEIEPPLDLTNPDPSLGDLNATDGDSAMTTATTASKAGKGHKTAPKAKSAKGAKKTSRTTKKTVVADSTLIEEPTAEVAETEMEVEPVSPPNASTPQASPSKRSGNVIGGLSSTQPWETVDLENVFLQSPGTRRMLSDNGEEFGKENGGNWEDLSLDEAVRKVRREMTGPEKKMTVEQWVQHQAEKGEQQLREQCERMVSVFETQGTKAMRALEGIRCSN